jgi:hypothetical protein
MEMPGQGGGKEQQGYILNPMPRWEKTVWILLVIYIIIVGLVFWYLGWKNLGFPL